MKMTREFMTAMGVGTDPADARCVAGFDLFASQYDLIMGPDSDAGASNGFVVARVEALLAANAIDQTHGRFYLMWLKSLRLKPEAIKYWGNEARLNQFRFQKAIFGSLSDAQNAKADELSRVVNDPLSFVSVSKLTSTQRGDVLQPVAHLSQIVAGQSYFIFNPKTGQNVEFAEPGPEIARQIGEERGRISAMPIYQKIKDPDEGFEAWERVT
ncbi:hypothetical protein ACGYK5_17820 [Sulfitobacter sp. 1A16787]|uniref:hypothetical protein n=1 Tax=Sulfitobacter sp. 1A16787 TaxID=3368571 RepID=UPI003746A5EF